MKKILVNLLKLGLLALCFMLIARKIHFQELRARVAEIRLGLVLPAFLTVLCEPLVMAIKWNLLLRTKRIQVGLPNLVRIIFTSNFLGITLPTSTGADALRLLMLKGERHSLTHSTSSLVADRVLAVLALVVLSFLALAVAWAHVPDKKVLLSVLSLAGLILSLVAALISPLPAALIQPVRQVSRACFRYLPRLEARATRLTEALLQKAGDVHRSLREFGRSPLELGRVFLLNIGIQLLRTLQVFLLFLAVRHGVPFMDVLAFVPMIILLTLLPISFFGLGIKEGAFLYFFTALQVPPEACLTVSLITYFLIFGALLPGAYFLLVSPPSLGGWRSGKAEQSGA